MLIFFESKSKSIHFPFSAKVQLHLELSLNTRHAICRSFPRRGNFWILLHAHSQIIKNGIVSCGSCEDGSIWMTLDRRAYL